MENEFNNLLDEKSAISIVMQIYGGKFVRRLGEVLERADVESAARIKATYPDAWAHYREMVLLMAARGEL